MTKTELHEAVAKRILHLLALNPGEQLDLDELSENGTLPLDTIGITINIESKPREHFDLVKDDETAYGIRIIVDGKDAGQRCGADRPSPDRFEYIQSTRATG